MRASTLFLLTLVTLAAPAWAARPTADDVFPAEVDPVMGDYVGRWSAEETVSPDIAAQVYPIGRGKYHVRITSKLDTRCPIIFDGEAPLVDGKISFGEGRFTGVIEQGEITGSRASGKITYHMKKVDRVSPTMGRAAPSDAVVLFDGTNLEQWTGQDGWLVTDEGYMMVTPDGGYLVSKDAYKDIELHVEFRSSLMPKAKGQQRGNSGVFVQNEYEIQVLDSYGLEGYFDECGALYKVVAPKVNACAPPLHWQTYDITFRAARYEGDKVVEYPRITVYQNGVLIHNDQVIEQITAWQEADRLAPPPRDAGHIKLQGHNNFVQFRNIWVREL